MNILLKFLKWYVSLKFQVEIKNIPSNIDVDDIELLFSDPRKYGEEVVIKDIKKKETSVDGVNSFIIEFNSEKSNLLNLF